MNSLSPQELQTLHYLQQKIQQPPPQYFQMPVQQPPPPPPQTTKKTGKKRIKQAAKKASKGWGFELYVLAAVSGIGSCYIIYCAFFK
jgi:hypothetical protein